MKTLFLVPLFIGGMAFAQVEDTGDKVGIGTTLSPKEKLDVNGDIMIQGATGANNGKFGALKFFNNYASTNSVLAQILARRGQSSFQKGDLAFYVKNGTSLIEALRMKSNGFIGVGTLSPMEKLDVNGDIMIQGATGANNGAFGALKFFNNYASTNSVLAQIQARRGQSSFQKGDLAFYVKNGVSLIEALRIKSNGNIGIGTTEPHGFKLGVNGKIAALEVKIATYANWPDYVFKDTYSLPALKDVAQHIKDNGHLKDIPSAEKVKEEGFYLGDMDAKLLRKIEELTLYTIAQQKKIDELNALKANHELLLEKFEALEGLISKIIKKQ